jgi:hypothetical protein
MLRGSEVEIKTKKKKEGWIEWCSALSRMYLVHDYTLGKEKRDTAPIVCYTKRKGMAF